MNSSGFRLPGEWEDHECTWLTWPQNNDTWGTLLADIEQLYSKLIKTICLFETVKLISGDVKLNQKLSEILGPSVEIINIPTNDCWIRDYGGLVCLNKKANQKVLYNFVFNAWGEKYPPWTDDNRIPERIAKYHRIELSAIDIVLEGGSIDSNGAGSIMTTTHCLLNSNRNPRKTRREIETILSDCFSLDNIIWLAARGNLAGDDTDGHVDSMARFTGPRTILCAVEHRKTDANFKLLSQNARELNRYAKDHSLEIREMPMPSPVIVNGIRTPASYLNFIFLNGAILVPVFQDWRDDEVLNQFENVFPDKKVIPVNTRALTYGLGGLHCITSHVFALL